MLLRTNSMVKALALCTAVLFLTLPIQAAEKVVSALTISDAIFKLMPPGRSMTAGYMMMMNNSGETQVLTSLRSDSADRVELHQHARLAGGADACLQASLQGLHIWVLVVFQVLLHNVDCIYRQESGNRQPILLNENCA